MGVQNNPSPHLFCEGAIWDKVLYKIFQYFMKHYEIY